MSDTTKDWNLPWTGACRCGAVTLKVSAAPLLTMACHCTGCQRMTSSAFSLSVAIPEEGFATEGPDPVRGGAPGSDLRHHFCPDCMSWLYTTWPGVMPFVNVRSALLDNAADLPPFVETQTAEKLPFARLDCAASYERFPDMEEMAALSARFAEEATPPGRDAALGLNRPGGRMHLRRVNG